MKPMVMAKTDAEFEAADQAVWTEMARRVLKGAAPDSLDRTDEDGLVTRALYPVDAPDPRAATATGAGGSRVQTEAEAEAEVQVQA